MASSLLLTPYKRQRTTLELFRSGQKAEELLRTPARQHSSRASSFIRLLFDPGLKTTGISSTNIISATHFSHSCIHCRTALAQLDHGKSRYQLDPARSFPCSTTRMPWTYRPHSKTSEGSMLPTRLASSGSTTPSGPNPVRSVQEVQHAEHHKPRQRRLSKRCSTQPCYIQRSSPVRQRPHREEYWQEWRRAHQGDSRRTGHCWHPKNWQTNRLQRLRGRR